MKRQAKRNIAVKASAKLCRERPARPAKRLALSRTSNAVTDIALSWIKERARRDRENMRPLDLTLRESIREYLRLHEMDSESPWKCKIRERINALLG